MSPEDPAATTEFPTCAAQPQPAAVQTAPSADPERPLRELLAAYAARATEPANLAFLRVLQSLNDLNVLGCEAVEKTRLGRTLSTALAIFVQPDFEILEPLAFPVLVYNAMIGNIMAGCLQTTTDSLLIQVQGQPQELYKTMVLYSARNETQVDVGQLLGINPDLTSKWLYQTWKVVFSGNCNEKVTRNLSRFLSQMDHRVQPALDIQELYFGCTYLGIPEERRAKELINQSIRKWLPVEIRNTPNPRKIAVFSEYWSKGHSVHRTLWKYIEALKADHELTLLHSIRDARELDTTLFDHVQQVPFEDSRLNASILNPNDFAAVVFPDIGMTLPSILMANLRIAPVQLMMTGHPVSTFGSQIDYFISGQEVDLPIIAQQNYSERLVLLPGFGAVHEEPTYEIQGRTKQDSEILINCSWYGQKIHWRCLETVNQALKECKHRVKLRIFAGNAPILHKGYAAFINDVSRQMTSCWVELVPHLPYGQYMAMMEEGDFAIDVFPYAGSNTVSDNLHLRKPTLVREGYRWFNRIGPAMLRSAGVPDLIATTDDEYARKLIRLVDDPDHRAEQAQKLQAADLTNTVYRHKGAREFAQFVRDAIAGHRYGRGTEPIVLREEPAGA